MSTATLKAMRSSSFLAVVLLSACGFAPQEGAWLVSNTLIREERCGLLDDPDWVFATEDGSTFTVTNTTLEAFNVIRDEEVIAAANRLGIAMMFTGNRHFKH